MFAAIVIVAGETIDVLLAGEARAHPARLGISRRERPGRVAGRIRAHGQRAEKLGERSEVDGLSRSAARFVDGDNSPELCEFVATSIGRIASVLNTHTGQLFPEFNALLASPGCSIASLSF
jgi:hypothetical protein